MQPPSDQARRRELAKIHIAKAQLGLDDGAYRAMLWTLARVRSAKDLDHGGRAAVLEHCKALGFKAPGRKPKRVPRHAGRPHSTDTRPPLQKIEALLAEAKRPWAYAVRMAMKLYAKERLEFCASDELQGIIAALMRDATRHGRRTG